MRWVMDGKQMAIIMASCWLWYHVDPPQSKSHTPTAPGALTAIGMGYCILRSSGTTLPSDRSQLQRPFWTIQPFLDSAILKIHEDYSTERRCSISPTTKDEIGQR